jgi:LmbE family N-acetylglucosaminyl deacetylase
MKKHYLFISAHLDDAILSCGDYIYELIQNGCQVTIATVFTGMGTELSMLARILHKKFGLGTDTMEVRRLEDIHAVESLSASHLHLGLLECIYRKKNDGSPVYEKLQDLFDTEWWNEAQVMNEVTSAIARKIDFKNYDGIFVPLGIGRHVDHSMVRNCAEKCWLRIGEKPHIPFYYYEDLPYLCYNKDKSWKDELAGGMHVNYARLSRISLKAKINAVKKYKSQLSLLWPSKLSMIRQIAQHPKSVYAERNADHPECKGHWFKVYTTNDQNLVPLCVEAT